MVLEESFDEEDQKSTILQGKGQSLHALGSKYNDLISPTKDNFMNGDNYLLNNGNKDLDLSTKIAPESDRQLDNDSKRIKSKADQEMSCSIAESGVKKKKRKVNKKRLVMNVAQTKYYVVRYVAKKIYKMKLTHNDDEDWDICW